MWGWLHCDVGGTRGICDNHLSLLLNSSFFSLSDRFLIFSSAWWNGRFHSLFAFLKFLTHLVFTRGTTPGWERPTRIIKALLACSHLVFLADKADDELEMTTVCHRPEGLEQLEAQTNFTKQELQILYRGFKNVIQISSIKISISAALLQLNQSALSHSFECRIAELNIIFILWIYGF